MQIENTQQLYLTRLLESEKVCYRGNIENKSESNDLKSFECKYCGETWYVKNTSENKVKACPFCLKSIVEVSVEQEHLEKVRAIELAFLEMIEKKLPTNKDQDEQIFALGKKMFCEKRYEESIKFIRYAVAKGNKDASFFLGYCYEYGIGVAKDEKAAQGFYSHGTFSNKKFKEFQHANKVIYRDKKMMLSMYARKLVHDTLELMKQNASAVGMQHTGTQTTIANGSVQKQSDKKDDPNERYELARSKIANMQYRDAVDDLYFAAQHGHKRANLLLGYCYEHGFGVNKDIKAAEGYYRLGINGNPDYKKYMGPYGVTNEAIGKASKDAALWFRPLR